MAHPDSVFITPDALLAHWQGFVYLRALGIEPPPCFARS